MESLIYYKDGVLSGDRRILAKATTLIEIRRHLDRTVAKVRQGVVGPATVARELLFLLDNP